MLFVPSTILRRPERLVSRHVRQRLQAADSLVGAPRRIDFYAWINAEIDSSKRATVLSIINQSDVVDQGVARPRRGLSG
jgi:hypothetical protein